MILQFILSELDRELERLGRLRTIVSSLSPLSAVAEAVPVPPPPSAARLEALPTVPIAAPEPKKPLVKRVYRRRTPGSTPAKPAARPLGPTALTANIPLGPVVVSAAMVQKQRTPAPMVSEVKADLTPDALLRELSTRWGTEASVSA